MLELVVALSLSIAAVPHRELPATFLGGRVFVMPRAADGRLVIWVDTDGGGFIRKSTVANYRLQQSGATAYLPPFDEPGFPPVTGNHGALPVLDDAQVAGDPVFTGIDAQLGWTWLNDRIWTIDYTGHHFYQDYSEPPIPAGDRVALRFDALRRYPRFEASIDGKTYLAALDTAASVALSSAAQDAIGDALPGVRATSFIPRRTLEGWHAAHPDWKYIGDAGASKGVSLILVPAVTAGSVVFRDVWFSSRPDDDVFQGENVDAKIGPSAFGTCAVTIDYVHESAGFECST